MALSATLRGDSCADLKERSFAEPKRRLRDALAEGRILLIVCSAESAGAPLACRTGEGTADHGGCSKALWQTFYRHERRSFSSMSTTKSCGVGLWKGEVVLEDLELYVPAPAWQKSPCMPGQIAKDARLERA